MPRISELPALAQATSGDIIPIVDDAGNITKKVTANKVVPDGSVVTSQLANSAVTTAKIGNGQVTAGKIDFTTFSKRTNNGVAGTSANMYIGGWAGATGLSTSAVNISVSFGVTFTEPPIVVAVYGGDKDSGPVSWPSGVGVKRGYVAAHSITTTGFTLVIYSSDGTNWTTGNSVYAQWTAHGSV